MKNYREYFLEYFFLATVIALTITGFWNIYFGADSDPSPHHHLHVATNFIWLFLLSCQLSLVGKSKYANHRKVGLSIMVIAPLLVATAASLSVHSAHKGLVTGQGDFLIVQNVGVTLELGLIILLAFVLRKRRRLHGSLILSTAMLFMGLSPKKVTPEQEITGSLQASAGRFQVAVRFSENRTDVWRSFRCPWSPAA